MSLPLKAPAAGSVGQGLDAWFIGLGDDFLGRAPADWLRPGMFEGWRIRWRGRELALAPSAFTRFRVNRSSLDNGRHNIRASVTENSLVK